MRYALCILLAIPLAAAELQSRTIEAFDQYIRHTEAAVAMRAPLAVPTMVIRPVNEKEAISIPGGLVHDWIAAVFVPGATLAKVLSIVQDYDNHKRYYKPEVVESRTLTHNGNDFTLFYRLVKKKVITITLNTEHKVHYQPVSAHEMRSHSFTTKVAEVAGAGKPGEHELAPGDDHGFLWKLHSFWRFIERDGGLYIECQAVSLTRDVPTGIGWIVKPIIRDLPRESLASTLRATRDML